MRDLGSSNGTSVDGKALPPRERVVLTSGSVLRFGDSTEMWTLVDVAPADPCAVLIGPQVYHWGDKALLVLPSPDAPEASIFPGGNGWRVDDGVDVRTAECGDVVRLPSGYWRLLLPETPEASAGTVGADLSLQQLELCLRVSAERVMAELSQGSVHVQLPVRACMYTLLALARLRAESSAAEEEAGWVTSAELAELRGCTQEKVNVDIHRLRKLLQEAGVEEPARIVERDDAKRLRIGARRVTIRRE